MTRVYKCPSCRKFAVITNSLGWRGCGNCGWKETLPAHLEGKEMAGGRGYP